MKCPDCTAEIIALQTRIKELEEELAEERYRHDRYVDFELEQSKLLEAALDDLKKFAPCSSCAHVYVPERREPCKTCVKKTKSATLWKWRRGASK